MLIPVHQLSPAEYDHYTTYLTRLLEVSSSTNDQNDISRRQADDGKVEKQVVKQFMVEKLGVDRGLVDQVNHLARLN